MLGQSSAKNAREKKYSTDSQKYIARATELIRQTYKLSQNRKNTEIKLIWCREAQLQRRTLQPERNMQVGFGLPWLVCVEKEFSILYQFTVLHFSRPRLVVDGEKVRRRE